MHVGRRISIGFLVVLIIACQPGPTVAPATEPIGEPTAAPTQPAPSGVAPSAGPIPTPPPPPPPSTSAEKIVAAEQAGAINHEAALLDRIYAVFGDPRLPDDLRGVRSEDLGALDDARNAFQTLSPEGQAIARSYMVRPTHPDSYWNHEPSDDLPAASGSGAAPTSSAAAGRASAASGPKLARPPAAPACANGWMSAQVSPNIPVKIWSQCFGDVLEAQAALEEARGDMATLYGPETSLLGVPPGDMNDPDDSWIDTPETGDGLIDIYLLDSADPSGHVRDFDTSGAYAVTASTPPITGPANAVKTAAYIVVSPGVRGLILESTLAHEFFHVLQYWHNKLGLWDCVTGSAGAACTTDTPRAPYWMVEASATWAEHRFVPAARALVDGPYDRFAAWRKTSMGLSREEANNAYHSWIWPLFVQQQSGEGAISRIWRAYEGKSGFAQLQSATNSIIPFDQTFREFGVRGWNELLNPGDPLAKHFFDASLDPTFPKDQPEGDRLLDGLGMDANDPGPHTEYLILDSLGTKYLPFGASGDAHTLVLDFTAMAPEIDVAALVQLTDGTWERRDLPAGETRWCLDAPSDAIQLGYLIFANHDLAPGVTTRAWSWDATVAGCGTSEGTLTFSSLDNSPGAGQSSAATIDASVQVHLKRNDGSAGFNAEFLNDGSTYGITTTSRTVLYEGVDGCSPTANSVGTPGGGLELDSITATSYRDVDSGELRLGISVDLPVHHEVEEFWCALGTGHSSDDGAIQFPECEGTEEGSTGDVQRFVFDCAFQGDTLTWTLTGTVLIDR